jgi:site-specific DNA recombinase
VPDAYGYTRGSTAKQVITTKAQEDRIRAYAQYQQYNLIKIYQDDDQSSKKPLRKRREGRPLEEGVESGRVKILIIAKLDRAFRNTVECLTSLDRWSNKGVNVHILDIGVDASTVYGRAFVSFVSTFAEMERSLIGQRTKAALNWKKENGELVCHPDHVEYGKKCLHAKQNGDGKYVEYEIVDDHKELMVIKKIMSLHRDKGWGGTRICNELERLGLKSRKGGRFNKTSIDRIIKKHK